MRDKKMNRFERNAKATTIVLLSALALCLAVGGFFLVKAVRDEARRGLERYIIMRERRPLSNLPQMPAKSLVDLADGLERRDYPFRGDADGYIVPSQVHAKPDLTVVFLGGSTTECMYMQEEERFPYLVGRQMEKSMRLKVNTLNGGNSGNHTLHSLLVLQGKVIRRKPQAVVLMECINDLNLLMAVGDYWSPHASRGIVFDKEYNPVKTFILKHFAGHKPLEGDREDEFAGQRGKAQTLDPEACATAYRKNLELFIFLCRQHDITPVLMTQFNRFTEHMEENLIKQMSGWNFDYPTYLRAYTGMQDTLRAVAAEQKVALIDLDRLVPKTKTYMFDVVHLNAEGARLVAGIIAERLPDVLENAAASGQAAKAAPQARQD